MKKMRLNTEDIQVVGFEMNPADASRGTVMGEQLTRLQCPTNGDEPTCRLGSCASGSPCGLCP